MQRYFATDKIDNKIILSDNDYHHIKNVMRNKDNELIEVVYNNKLYKSIIKSVINKDIEAVEEINQIDDKIPYIRLIIPTLKEQKLDYIFQKCTEIGINEFVVVPFERSMVKYEERKEKTKIERWNKICKEASEQSKRIDIPLITIEHNFKFISELDGLRLICSTNEKDNYIKYALKNKGDYDKITLVIGPEGGISDKEEAYFEENGFKKITLGTQIMRAETVPVFLASIIRYECTE